MDKTNYHTHTKRCKHATGDDREYIECAIQSGFKVLGFSDHCPYTYCNGYISFMRMGVKDIDGYFYSLQDLQSEYKQDIKIYIGFEEEFFPNEYLRQKELLDDYPVDYFILGQHSLLPEPLGKYSGNPTSNDQELTDYVDLVIAGINTGRYLYLAHPDLLNYVGNEKLYYSEYKRLCECLKKNNIPIEINLLGIASKRHYTSNKFLKIASEVGNSAIIGFDAHSPQSLLDNLNYNIGIALTQKNRLKLVDYLPMQSRKGNK